jgi:PAS domain-containing protein
MNSAGLLLGVFSIFHNSAKVPATSDIELMEYFARLAGVVIERHQAQKELQCATMVYQAIGEAVLVTDQNGLVVAVNSGFTKMVGYGQEEIIGQTSHDVQL